MATDGDYLIGTGNDEIARLALQHRVWRPRVLDAWRRAGFTVGQTLVDIGCGPGNASVDLAEIVGDSGRVIAIDRSRRFLDALQTTRQERKLAQLQTLELDLEAAELPRLEADGAWCRWVLAFLKDPRNLLTRIAGTLKRGGVFVAHEYFDYATWRLTPRCSEVEEFVELMMKTWRMHDGEPDVGLNLPRWLAELGFEITSLRPVVHIIPASDFLWQWTRTFIYSGLRRLVELDQLTSERARAIAEAFEAREAAPHTLMITPAVLEILAVRK
jgi:ubiquinone/menaquinone biosynthesis C-methylase UbiE